MYTQNGNGHRLLDGRDHRAVDTGLVHLFPRPSVDADHGRACVLDDAGHLGGVDGCIIPSGTDLDGDRQGHSPHHSADDLSGQPGVFEEGTTLAVCRDLSDGTAHIDVNGGGGDLADTADIVVGFQHPGGLCHEIRLATKELDRHGEFVGHDRGQVPRHRASFASFLSLLVAKCLGRHHFADRKISPAGAADTPKSTVADPCQGGKGKAVGQSNVSEYDF